MSEYWVSRDKYFCKYCKTYIADDKPSRLHHDSGMRHKGNYERYIRDIYKRGERDIRDKNEEAKEIARMEAAAHAAMVADGTPVASTSSLPPPSTKPKPTPKPTDPFANYSTAADLGFVDPESDQLGKLLLEQEARQAEGTIGGWQKVVKPPPAVLNQKRLEEEKAREEEEKEWKAREEKRLGKYFKEKTLTGEEDEYHFKHVSFNLKRKRLTLKEEADLAAAAETQGRIKRERDEEREKESARRRKQGKLNGWDEVTVEAQPMLSFDDENAIQAKVEDEPYCGSSIKSELGRDEELNDAKLVVTEDVKPATVGGGQFKKRKMMGANAARKR